MMTSNVVVNLAVEKPLTTTQTEFEFPSISQCDEF